MKTGDILYSAWGYEQTNVDFYDVIKATAKTVTVRHIEIEKRYTDDMSGNAVPVPGAYKGPELRRKVIQYYDRPFISINSYRAAYPYENQPIAFSEYA